MTLANKLRNTKNFGGIDASVDQVLLAAFEDHSSYRDALTFERPIIVGRKGAGKSAVYQKITREKHSDRQALGFTFSDYPWQHHILQKQVGVPDEECYRESWKYFISLMICKLILKSKAHVSSEPAAQTALNDIHAFVTDSYGSVDPTLTTIFTPGQKIKLSGKLNFWAVGAEVKTIDIENLPTFYSEINRNMMDCIIRCIPRDTKFYVCFDELDIGFDPNNPDYLHRLIGLIRATKYVNDSFTHENLRAGVIILLREDIWHFLKFEDKNKITQSQVSTIKWSQEPGPHCLKRLMERRFDQVLGDGRSVSWESVFDESKTMAQFQTKYDFICRRTFLRPRDMIQFCNEVLTAFKADSEKSDRLETDHVKTAEREYSRYFIFELEDELHKHSPSYQRYFEVLKRLLNVGFSRDEFEAAWHEQRTLFDDSETPNQALQALFEFSVVGFLATGGHGAGSKYVWRYLEPKTLFDQNARSFQVRLGLKEEFELKLYARRKGKAAS
jgi:hypothetical protein